MRRRLDRSRAIAVLPGLALILGCASSAGRQPPASSETGARPAEPARGATPAPEPRDEEPAERPAAPGPTPEEAALERARSGELTSSEREEVLRLLTGSAEPRRTVDLLCGELARVTALLDRGTVPAERLAVAGLCCEALARIGGGEPAVAALGRYLRAERDEARAAGAAVALCRLGGEAAEDHVLAAWRRFGTGGAFWHRVARHLRRTNVETRLREPTARGYLERGAVRAAKGSFDGALADLDRAVELDPGATLAWLTRAGVRVRRGDLRGALEDYARAIELDPRLAEAFLGRGMAMLAMGEAEAAIADFDRALEIDPASALARFGRGCAHHSERRLEAAVADYDRAIELAPWLADAWENRGGLRHAQGDEARAKRDYARAIELDPAAVYAHLNLGVILQREKRLAEAIVHYRAAVEHRPDLAVGWRSLAEALADLCGNQRFGAKSKSDQEAALAAYERAATLAPNDVEVLFGMANLLVRMGRREDAGAVWLRRANLWEHSGNVSAVIADLKRFLVLAPEHPEAAEARRRLDELERQSGQ